MLRADTTGVIFLLKNNWNQFMFKPKTNRSQAYVFKMLTLPKNITVTLGRRAKGHHDLVKLAQFLLFALA